MNADDLQHEDAPEIASRAFDALKTGDLASAQDLAHQLEALRYSAHFEIQAEIYSQQGNPAAAIEILRAGVTQAASAWPLWELLGNCLSDNGDFEEALDSYTHGLQLDLEEEARASLQFNRATVLNRMRKHEEALKAVEDISKEVLRDYVSLRWRVEGLRLRVLAALRECDQVLTRAIQLQQKINDVESEDSESLSVFWEQGGRALEECGEIELAQQWALESLDADRTYAPALRLLRDTSPGLPQASRYFQVLLQGDFPNEDGESLGFFTLYSVVARVAEEAEQLALQMELPRWQTPPHVSECRDVGDCELQPIGVFDVGPYHCFPLNTEDEDES